jgi:peptidoglycan hydrolase CwlO-like protein/3D (Asp-Asp-Asp) domain-containing protein
MKIELRGIVMKKRIFSSLLAGLLVLSLGCSVYADTEDELSYAREQKAAAQASLDAAQSNISSLESKKQELESYLADLNAQYSELNDSIAEIDAQVEAKEEELVQVKADLKQAQIDEQNQYDAMKIRIVYMFERGGANALQMLLSSKSFADFLNQAENVMALSTYDRDMLTKYENTCSEVEAKEAAVDAEVDELQTLLEEQTAKQQEVEAMQASTNANIQSYVSQISASEEEASYLMAQVENADNNIYSLMAQAEAEREAEEAAAYAASTQDSYDEDSYDTTEDSGESYEDSYDESYDDSYDSYEEASEESSYEEASSESSSSSSSSSASSSSSGTYLGNFKLTGYCNCASCCGTAGNATASGVYPTSGHTVAMAGVPFGTKLLINGTVYTVEDLGTPYGHVDIYFDSHSAALSFGLQYADVYQLN